MSAYRARAAWIASTLLLFSCHTAYCQEGEGAELIINYPKSDTVLNEKQFTMLTVRQGPQSELAEWDHTHYGVGLCDSGDAELAVETSTASSGVEDIDLDLLNDGFEGDGCYRLCAYMARADHTHLSLDTCVDFTVATNQFIVGKPSDGDVFPQASVEIAYNFAGANKPASVSYKINDGEPKLDQDLDGSIELELANGEYVLEISAIGQNSYQIGETISRNFTVSSKLSLENLAKLKRVMRKAKSITNRKARKKLKRILQKMNDGGEQHPLRPNLNDSTVSKALQLARRADKQASKDEDKFDRLMSKLEKLVKRMGKS